MNINLTKDQEAIQNAVREFLVKEAKDLAREAEDSQGGYSPEIWQKMAILGWMGVGFPEEYGGSGGDFVDLILMLEEMGRVLLPGPYIPTVICSGQAIFKYGTELQKKEFLSKLTKGELIIIPAIIAPESSTGKREMTDQVVTEKEDYILSGTRLFVPYAHMAGWLIYGAKINSGKTLFLVNTKDPGVTSRVLKTIASDKQCEVILERVRVPRTNILGDIGRGEEIMSKINEWGALAHCGFILGLLEQVLKMTVEYVKKREQFGRLIGSFQAIQHQCADMATDVDQVKFLTYQAAWKLSQQYQATKEISMAKARASDASRRVCLLGIKIHGGIGIIIDYDMQLYFRKAKAAELTFGDGDFHREVVAQQIGL